MTKWVRLVFFLIIAGVLIGFALLNAQPVSIDLFLGRYTLPLALLLLFVWILGIVMSGLFIYPSLIKMKWINRRLQKQNEKISSTKNNSGS